MFEKLDALLKAKYKGKKLMEIDPRVRNDMDKDLDIVMDEILEKFGAKGMTLYLLGEDDSLTVSHHMNIEGMLKLYENIQEKLVRVFPKQVITSLSAAQSSQPSGVGLPEDVAEAMAGALQVAVSGLPPDMQKLVKSNVRKTLRGEDITKASDANGESGLLDDLLN